MAQFDKERVVAEFKNFHLSFINPAAEEEKAIVIRGVDLELYRGEVLALIGESGSGKSVLTSALYGLAGHNARIDSGIIKIKGQEVQNFTEKDWQKAHLRGKVISAVFQNPSATLTPTLKIGKQIMEGMLINKLVKSKREAYQKAIEYLEKTKINNAAEIMELYPHELSGGMKQRVVIASIIACQPEILILDEPTTALDPVVQAQIIDIIDNLAKEYKISIIFISHDLGVVASIAHRIAIMYAGQIVEYGKTEEVLWNSHHPYTWGLLLSSPDINTGERLVTIRGNVPSTLNEIKGDAFALRNDYALGIDFKEEAPFFEVSKSHFAKTWLLDKRAPEIKIPEIIQWRQDHFLQKQKANGSLNSNKSPSFKLPKKSEDKANLSHYQKGATLFNNKGAAKLETPQEIKIAAVTLEKRLAHDQEAILNLENVNVVFKTKKSFLQAVNDFSIKLYKGEVLGLVGESGSGKSTIGNAVVGMLKRKSGKIVLNDILIPKNNHLISRKKRKQLMTNVQMIFQDPANSLNPHKNIFKIVSEGLDNVDIINHYRKIYFEETEVLAKDFKDSQAQEAFLAKREKEFQDLITKKTAKSEIKKILVIKTLKDVGLDETILYRYPLEFSGGQQQRINIARVIAMRPKILVADEPISSLDVSIQAQVINLFNDLKKSLNLSILFIAHDLRMVEYISDRIAIIYRGQLLEIGAASEIISFPLHPYTRALIEAIPTINEFQKDLLQTDYDPEMHAYTKKRQPSWFETKKQHFVYGTEAEIREWIKIPKPLNNADFIKNIFENLETEA